MIINFDLKMTQLRTKVQAAFTYYFCFDLEAHLSVAFKNCDDKKYSWLRCYGVQMPDWYKQPFRNPRYISTLVGIGDDWRRQQLYKMTIKLGKLSLVNCCENSSLIGCLPDFNSLDWVTLDMENKAIVLRLK